MARHCNHDASLLPQPSKMNRPESNRQETIALTRNLSNRIAQCELSYIGREPIDLEKARQQHLAYRDTLAGLGLRMLHLEDASDFADGVFVEDPAVVIDEAAVITRVARPDRARE